MRRPEPESRERASNGRGEEDAPLETSLPTKRAGDAVAARRPDATP